VRWEAGPSLPPLRGFPRMAVSSFRFSHALSMPVVGFKACLDGEDLQSAARPGGERTFVFCCWLRNDGVG
jgi:hypothetical protein